jgi:flagellar biosynthetic protein FlhB
VAENTGQERTEKGTGKRRSEARKRGQVANSREIPATLILLAALGVFHFAGGQVFAQCSALVSAMFRNLHTMRLGTITAASAMAADLFQTVIVMLLPFFVPFLVAGLVGNVAQIGFEIHGGALGFKFSAMNPLAGIKRIFSLRGLVELAKSILKIGFIGGIAYSVVSGYLKDFPALVRWDLGALWSFTAAATFKIIFYVFLAMLVLSALDYLYQRWQYEESLKMTKQEVTDEHKQSEGDPKVKSRIRSLQRQTAYHRMMAEVPKADVVITNPTQLAIALRFTSDEMPAPRVVAKGAGTIAERIRETAREHNVPIVENKPLAQTLFKMTELGDYIPVDLYRAVAEVLAYVYRLKGKSSL